MHPLRILIASAECEPPAVVGGVAQFVPSIARALRRRGHDARVVIPHYGYLSHEVAGTGAHIEYDVPLGGETVRVRVRSIHVGHGPNAVPVYLVDCHQLFTRAIANAIYLPVAPERWIAFARAVVAFIEHSDWMPAIVHCQDAHTSMIPVFLAQRRAVSPGGPLAKVRTLLTIHNLLDQGKGDASLVAYAGLPASAFHELGFEFYGGANCMKAGILAADAVNTVSRSYANEICASDDVGFGLSGVLAEAHSNGRLTGIVNGIDEALWRMAGFDYAAASLLDLDERKRAAREALLPSWGWAADGDPVLSFRARWDWQKGPDLLVDVLADLAARWRIVVCTWGTPGAGDVLRTYWESLNRFAAEHADRVLVNPAGVATAPETATHYLVTDAMLMPSRYEPCGLVQMESQRYGVVPIVRRTGGLADTVREGDNGFTFDAIDAAAMVAAAQRARAVLADEVKRSSLLRSVVTQNNGWDMRMSEYEALYASIRASVA